MFLVHKLRDLTLRAPSAPGRPLFLSAASSLVAIQSWLYVIADDELHLGVFPAHGNGEGKLIRLLEGVLPDGPKKRKRRKPDFEAQVLLPPFGGCRHGSLLAIGSGSKSNRRIAVQLSLDAKGIPASKPRLIDLSGLLSELDNALGELNIEGVFVQGSRLVFLQRRNSNKSINAIVSLDLNAFLQALDASNATDELPFHIVPVDLGSLGAIPWGFTDAAALPDGRVVFTAVAEDSDSSYLDGPCAGAAVGILAHDGQLVRFEQLQPTIKAEGVAARLLDGRIHLLLVTDADNASVPAGLWETEIGPATS